MIVSAIVHALEHLVAGWSGGEGGCSVPVPTGVGDFADHWYCKQRITEKSWWRSRGGHP